MAEQNVPPTPTAGGGGPLVLTEQLSGLVTGERVTVADILPCGVCGWMRLPDAWDCTCGRPEARAAVVRPWLRNGHRAPTALPPAA